MRAVYDELHNTLMGIDEHDDLRWWKNTHGPGMPTDWPHFQVFSSISNHFYHSNQCKVKFFFLLIRIILLQCLSGMDAREENQEREEGSRKERHNREEVSKSEMI